MDVTSGVEMTHFKSQAFFTDIYRTHPVCLLKWIAIVALSCIMHYDHYLIKEAVLLG
jgi:hypothetical protein